MKFFDPSLAEDDPDNYYMEREWRSVRSVRFPHSAIARIYLAPGFGRRFVDASTELSDVVRELGQA